MPELPEVETIRNALAPVIVGERFIDAEIFWPRSLSKPAVEEFRFRLAGQVLKQIRRRGKYFLFDLSGGEILGVHLKMTGTLLLKGHTEEIEKYTTAVFRFEGERDMHFVDQRKFGAVWLVQDEKEITGKLGPEPLEKAFTPQVFHQILSRHSIPIKALLCDQHRLAGIGNMYADEALYAARIHPLRKASQLTRNEVEHLHHGIVDVLKRGIRHNGASVSAYCLPDGTKGMAHTQFQVAHKLGDLCTTCNTPITRIKVRGRGSYFCPACQHE